MSVATPRRRSHAVELRNMPIEITARHGQPDDTVDDELVIDTIERNRERVRTVGNMSLTVSGIMVSSSVAFVLFIAEKQGPRTLVILFTVATALFFAAASLSLVSAMLRTRVVISTRTQFVADLMRQYNSELSLLRWSFLPLFLGFMCIIIGVMTFITNGERT